MISPAQLAAKLNAAAVQMDRELVVPTEAVMVVVEAQAREVIGTYLYGWTPLAEATKADRVRQGYPEDEPLLRTGALADSIHHMVEDQGSVVQGLVWSGDIVALWQEMGTSRGIPPRSFLFGSLFRAIPDMERIYSAYAVRLLTE